MNRGWRNFISLVLGTAMLAGAVYAVSQSAPSASGDPEKTRAQGANYWKGPDEVYDKVCKHCHDIGIGPELKGKKYASQLTFAMVRVGPGAMPAFRQTDIDDAMLKKLGEWLQKSDVPNPPNEKAPGYIAAPPSLTAPVKAKTVKK